MTASEAREAADFFRREVAIGEQMIAATRHPLIDASEHWQGVADIAKVTAFKRAAAVALDAYADGIDAAAREREACAATLDEQAARLAKLADEYIDKGDNRGPVVAFAWSETLEGARAIRARGQP